MSKRTFAYVACSALQLALAQGPGARVQPQVSGKAVSDSRVTVLYVAPRYATAIRMHEPVNSVIVGDPASFSAEHSEQEPNLIFVKPITAKPAQTNLLISTARGHEASLLLISRGEVPLDESPPVDFMLRYQPAGRFLVEPSDYPSALVAETADLKDARGALPMVATTRTATTAAVNDPPTHAAEAARTALDELLERQRRSPLPELHGGKPGLSDPGKEPIRAGISEVIDQGREVVVLFSVVNPQRHGIELMPPQVQLGGKVRSGKIFRRSRWGAAEQFLIADYRLSSRRIGPGERADGVVVFDRPPYKQSNETLFLQVAESGAVDRPALAPIGFGISSFQLDKEGPHGKPSGEKQ